MKEFLVDEDLQASPLLGGLNPLCRQKVTSKYCLPSTIKLKHKFGWNLLEMLLVKQLRVMSYKNMYLLNKLGSFTNKG